MRLLFLSIILLCYETLVLAKDNDYINEISSICFYGMNQNVFTPVDEDRMRFFKHCWESDGAKHEVIRDSIEIQEFINQIENAEIIDTLNFTTKQSGNEYYVNPKGWLFYKTKAKEPIGAIKINYKNGRPLDIIWITRETMDIENIEYVVPKAILDRIKSLEKRPSQKMINFIAVR